MTDIDISPEAVERLACILEWRGGFVKDSTITATLRALSAALTQSRAETAAAYERAAEMCIAPEAAHIAWYMKWGNFPKRSARHEFIAAMIRALTTPEQSSALAAIEAAAEARGMRKAAEIAQLNAWCHQGVDAYSQGMDAGARHQCKVINDAILAAIPQGDTTND